MDWLTKYELDRKVGGFGQAIVAVTLGERFTLAAAPTYVSNTPLFTDVFNVPLMVQLKMGKGFYATGEYVFRNKDLDGLGRPVVLRPREEPLSPPLLRLDRQLGRLDRRPDHGGRLRGRRRDSNIRLGFNLIRQFEIGKKP